MSVLAQAAYGQTFMTETAVDTAGMYGPRTDSLEAAVFVSTQEGNYLSKGKPIRTEVISSSGLRKMACCTLAESFENSASVTVGYSDAVTGARQIRLLGLSGIYTQMLDETRPVMRGIASPFGLSYVPGQWLESIQIAKGAASVISGVESVTGQINLEHRKPTDEKPLFLKITARRHPERLAETSVECGKTHSEIRRKTGHVHFFREIPLKMLPDAQNPGGTPPGSVRIGNPAQELEHNAGHAFASPRGTDRMQNPAEPLQKIFHPSGIGKMQTAGIFQIQKTQYLLQAAAPENHSGFPAGASRQMQQSASAPGMHQQEIARFQKPGLLPAPDMNRSFKNILQREKFLTEPPLEKIVVQNAPGDITAVERLLQQRRMAADAFAD